jgi:hypothetical protein
VMQIKTTTWRIEADYSMDFVHPSATARRE